jgi:hypothetical protein
MRKFFSEHHFTSLLIIALAAAFGALMYLTEVASAEANQALTPTPLPLELTPTPAPPSQPGDTTGIVLWGVVIVAIIITGLLFSKRQPSLRK